MKVAALAGGVGGAKLLVGLQRALGRDVTAIVNTGDDALIHGVHVSPDVDIVTYWLAGIADTERGWGIRGDAFSVVDAIGRLGGESWFRLGDMDFATCIYRTQRLEAGATLSSVTRDIAEALDVEARILPMSDDAVATHVVDDTGRTLAFQDYFVRERTEPTIVEILLEGIESARPAPGVLDAIDKSDLVIVCPSNPIVSIGPILALAGVREALRSHPSVIAVSPIVGGVAIKGPADRLLKSLGEEASARGVARLYADVCNVFVVDETDREDVAPIAELGMEAIALDTIMTDHDVATRLARELLAT